ncbi:Kinase [Quillaja saponaria]|uniref:non-specific serine/threonine protein kinase n=1 Tax=Quillaja saponaria TaxID=32244 RepID=A0AAD7L9X4_QUISA|nr:Kinase [Quillaja saponaria]
MRKTELSTILFLCFLFLLLFVNDGQAKAIHQVCSSSCGDIQNISYPFRLNTDPPSYGDPEYQLTCENNKTMVDYLSGKYYVKQISYDKQIIRVVDANLADGSCSFPSKWLEVIDIRFTLPVNSNISYTSFLNCSTIINYPSYVRVPCLSRHGYFYVYAVYNNESMYDFLESSCKCISTAYADYKDMKYTSYDAIQQLLKSGFEIGWSIQCRDCIRSGKVCDFFNQTSQNFKCSKRGKGLICVVTDLVLIILMLMLFCVQMMDLMNIEKN